MMQNVRDRWFSFWYHLIYRHKYVKGYRKVINRFTGEFRVYKVSPLARVGVHISQEQADKINELMRGERAADAQKLILVEIEKEFDLDGLPEAFVKAARECCVHETLPPRWKPK